MITKKVDYYSVYDTIRPGTMLIIIDMIFYHLYYLLSVIDFRRALCSYHLKWIRGILKIPGGLNRLLVG